MDKADALAVLDERRIFQRAFGTSEGRQVMAWILNDCGYWSMDPERVRPELLAFANRLMAKCGIVHPGNLHELADVLVSASNNTDLEAMLSTDSANP